MFYDTPSLRMYHTEQLLLLLQKRRHIGAHLLAMSQSQLQLLSVHEPERPESVKPMDVCNVPPTLSNYYFMYINSLSGNRNDFLRVRSAETGLYCCLQGQLCGLRLWILPNGKMIEMHRIMRIIRIQMNSNKSCTL